MVDLGMKAVVFVPLAVMAFVALAVKVIIFGKLAAIIAGLFSLKNYFVNGGSILGLFNHAQPATYYADSSSSSWNSASAQPAYYTNQYYDNSNGAKLAYAAQQPQTNSVPQ